jgi:hypothetical protein
MLSQHPNNLILGKSASPHHSSPSDELTYQWHDFWGAGQGLCAAAAEAYRNSAAGLGDQGIVGDLSALKFNQVLSDEKRSESDRYSPSNDLRRELDMIAGARRRVKRLPTSGEPRQPVHARITVPRSRTIAPAR